MPSISNNKRTRDRARQPTRKLGHTDTAEQPTNRAFRKCWEWAKGDLWTDLQQTISQAADVEAAAWREVEKLNYRKSCFLSSLYALCEDLNEVTSLTELAAKRHWSKPPIGFHGVISRLKEWAKTHQKHVSIHNMDENMTVQTVMFGRRDHKRVHLCYFDMGSYAHLAPAAKAPTEAPSALELQLADEMPVEEPVEEEEVVDIDPVVKRRGRVRPGAQSVYQTPCLRKYGLCWDVVDLSECAWWVGTQDGSLLSELVEPVMASTIEDDLASKLRPGLWAWSYAPDDEQEYGFVRVHYANGSKILPLMGDEAILKLLAGSWQPLDEHTAKPAWIPEIDTTTQEAQMICDFWGEWIPEHGRMITLKHQGGWFAERAPVAMPGLMDTWSYQLKVERPHLCTATAASISTFGVGGLFVEVAPVDQGLMKVSDRRYCDGHNVVEPFYISDVITYNGVDYVARAPVDGGLKSIYANCGLKLITLERVDSSVRGGMRSILDSLPLSSWRTPTVSIRSPYQSSCDQVMLNRSKWMIAALKQADPTRCALINRQRLEESKTGYGTDPDAKLIDLATLAKQYPEAKPCYGVFKWGYCYSCGSSLPAKKMQSRICKSCLGNNSQLARLVAEGDKICGTTAKVHYPGVVWTTSRHPPLKKTVKTVATESCLSISGMKLEQALTIAPIERPGPALFGIGIDGAIPFVSSTGIRPLVEAVCYRIFKEIPRTAEQSVFVHVTKLLDLKPLLGNLLWRKIRPMTVYDWVKSMTKSSRRKALLKAAHDLESRGELHPSKAGTFSVFVKTENLPYFAQTDDGSDWSQHCYVARLINGPFDEDHVIAGVSLKPIIHELKAVWDVHNWIFYASVAPSKLNVLLNSIADYPSFLCSDFTAFDSTFTDYTWDMIESVYQRILVDLHPHFWEILRRWRRPSGSSISRKEHCRLKFQANTCNASGRDDTALANALFNGIATACSLASALESVPLEELQCSHLQHASEVFRIAIVGDDSLVASKMDLELLRHDYEKNITRFGLIVKAQLYTSIHDVTFLGQAPYTNCKAEWAWGPTIGRRLYKAGWKADRGGNYPAWIHGVAQQNALYANVPILSDWAQQILKLMSGQKRTDVVFDENRPWAMPDVAMFSYDSDTLKWVAYRYRHHGVSVDMMMRDIQTISEVERLPAVVHLESVERILQADEL